MRKSWILAALAAITLLGGFAFARGQAGQEGDAQTQTQAADTTIQPIAFPHDTHAGTYQMECQYCHFSAERSVDAGIPPVASCMGCHQLVAGRNSPEEIEKLRGYWNRREPIPWVRIYKISDHAHFPHSQHINAGLECQECHGQVEEMGVIQERDPAWGGDNMGWCISCHVEEDAPRDCTVCHY